MKDMEKVMKALSDKTRLRILNLLGPGPLCVCEVVEVIGLSQSTVSKHLSLLKDAGLIQDERRGKWIYYALNPGGDVFGRKVLALVLEEARRDPGAREDLAACGRCRCGPDGTEKVLPRGRRGMRP
ncbi:MAG: metalloregulator ArsR/SmtB family transcription factor [Acidobacteriota bacterium]